MLVVAYAGTIAAVAVVVAAGATLTASRPRRQLASAAVPVLAAYVALLFIQPASLWVSTPAVLVAGVAAGGLIGGSLRSSQAVVAFAVAAAGADAVSFFWAGGLTRHIVEAYRAGGSRLLLYLSVSVPAARGVIPVVGVGDVIVLAAACHALARLGTPAAARVTLGLATLGAALAVGLVVRGVAAVPFIAAGVILYLWVAGRRAGPSASR